MEENEIDIQIIKKAIFTKYKLILLVTIIGTLFVGFYIYSKASPTSVYEASTTLYLSDDTTKNKTILSAQDNTLASNYRQLLISDKVTSAIIEKANMNNLSQGELTSELTIQNKNGAANVFEIIVGDRDANRAINIANISSDVFLDKVIEMTGQSNMSIIDYAKDYSEVTQSNNKGTKVILCGLFLLMLSSFASVLLEIKNKTVKSVKDVESILGYSVIGIIPEMDIK